MNINRNYVTFGALVIITINLSSCGLTVKGFASLFDKIVYSDWNIVIIYTEDKMISLIFSGPDCWRSQSLRKLITQDALELFSSSLHFLLCAKIILLSVCKPYFEYCKQVKITSLLYCCVDFYVQVVNFVLNFFFEVIYSKWEVK